MKSIIKRLSAICLFAVTAFLLAGCAKVDLSLKINTDGSADWGLNMLLSDAAAKQAGADIWEIAKQELEAQGCAVADLKSGGYSGISATRHYKSVEDLTASGQGTESIFAGANPAFTIKTNKGFFTTTYDIRAYIDPSKIAFMPAHADETAEQLMEQVQLTMAVSLPARAATHNATSVSADGLTYTWELSAAKANSIELSANVPNMGNIVLAGGGAALVIAALVSVLIIRDRKRKAARSAERKPEGRLR